VDGAEPAQDLAPVHLRQAVVEEHHGGIEPGDRLHRLLAVARLSHLPALALEDLPDVLARRASLSSTTRIRRDAGGAVTFARTCSSSEIWIGLPR